MRKPPPLSQLPRFPATGGVSLLALATTIVTQTKPALLDRVTIDGRALHGEPWRFVTAALPHSGVLHLAFNLYWLWVFGTLLEEKLGHARTLALFALFAAGSVAAEYALFVGGVGLSGVGYGLFGMLWMLGRRDARFAGAVDGRTIRLFLWWGLGCVVATIAHVLAIANAAHAMGLALGVTTGLALAKRRACWAAVAALCLASAIGATVARPWVNLARTRAAQSEAWAAQQTREAGKRTRAVAIFRLAVALDPSSSYLLNLCDAEHAIGRNDDAFADCMRACDRGGPLGCSYAGTLAELGWPGRPTDYVLARRLLQRGCDANDAFGCANLARYYEKSDAAVAAKLYAKACAGGERSVCAQAKRLQK